MTKIISISGNAGVGKDSLARILQTKLPKSSIYSLAYTLRLETEGILRQFGYNVWSQDRSEKEVFRNFLVEYAELARKSTKGTYYWKKLQEAIELNKEELVLVPDVRYDEYENDEVWWVKQNGILVYIEAYKNGSKVGPANYKEEQNEGKLAAKCDHLLVWDHQAQNDEQIYLTNKAQIDSIITKCFKNS